MHGSILGIWFAIAVAGCSSRPETATIGDRIKQLERQVEHERHSSEQAVKTYVPKAAGKLDDLTTPAGDILRELPGVADVEVLVKAPKPTHRVIHVRDWHFVSRDAFALDFEQTIGKPLSDQDYREHLLQVELVQLEQAAVLRCLIKHHGLKRVLAEGLTAEGVMNFAAIIDALREMDERLAKLVKQREDVRQNAPAIDTAIAELRNDFRQQIVQYGAVGRLALAREVEVWPLDDEQLLDKANPVLPDGRIKLEAAKVQARHDAQVAAARKAGPCSSSAALMTCPGASER
jgi:hypothetical protein